MDKPSDNIPPSVEEVDARIDDALHQIAAALNDTRQHYGEKSMYLMWWNTQARLHGMGGQPLGVSLKCFKVEPKEEE